ncbi:lytic transglycosylase domain-containing protein [Streptomyces sp. NPDC086783]|uniref:lytic transglycosylase domain-containing protein n=1 Tax=Streptomyces sp. NPDC086783 TaxID=3365758 RepID=UPI003806DDCA
MVHGIIVVFDRLDVPLGVNIATGQHEGGSREEADTHVSAGRAQLMAARFSLRLRRGATTTVVVAAAVATLSASQPPEETERAAPSANGAPSGGGAILSESSPSAASGNTSYYTDLPPLQSPNPPVFKATTAFPKTTEAGIPATVLDAYKDAEAELKKAKPGCGLPWQLLAAIGKVESGQARGGRVDTNGNTITPILGPVLNGSGFANIADTDDGVYDGDSTYDRAIGPMQFIPSTWEWAGRDGNGDGKKNPNNVYDAAFAAAHYLCRNDWHLPNHSNLERAILSYNNSADYLRTVLTWLRFYRNGTHAVPDGSGQLPIHRSHDNRTRRNSSTPQPVGTASKPAQSRSGSTHPPARNIPASSPPSPKPSKPAPSKPPTHDTPSEQVPTFDHLTKVSSVHLSARTEDLFVGRISTRAVSKTGGAVAGVRIRFTVTGTTDSAFVDGKKVATVMTTASGIAVAPPLRSGQQWGDFIVQAQTVKRPVKALKYPAVVTPRPVDSLSRTVEAPLTCLTGDKFPGPIQIKATYKGAAAEKTPLSVALITQPDWPVENQPGPYFVGSDGHPVRHLEGLRTDNKGILSLPDLYAGDHAGTFLLRVTSIEGETLLTNLQVVHAPDAPHRGPVE